MQTITDQLVASGAKGLTLHSPWGDLIALKAKQVENRSWPTDYRGLVLIHSGLRHDGWAERDEHVRTALPEDYDPAGNAGTVVAVARLADCHRDAGCCRPWGEAGLWHWVFADVHRLTTPIPQRGAQGLWSVPVSLLLGVVTGVERAASGR
jgi:hypothetical protein